MPRFGPDVSNYTGAPNAAWDRWVGNGIDVLFPQAIHPPAGYPPDVTVPQVQWGLDRGLLVVPYIWKWFGTGIQDIQRRLDLLTPFTGLVDAVVLDVEDTSVGPLALKLAAAGIVPRLPVEHVQRMHRQPPPELLTARAAGPFLGISLQQRVDEVAKALELIDTFPTKSERKCGVYTGCGWFWGPYMGNTSAFVDRDLWNADYDGIVDPNVGTSGPWARQNVKQYQGTTTFNGVPGVDLNVLQDDYLPPVPPPVAVLFSGPGINVGLTGTMQPDPARLKRLGFTWARIVSRVEAADYIDQLLRAGLEVLPVVTSESQGWVPPGVRVVQFGNESDSDGPASWPKTQDEYVSLFNIYQGTYPQFAWVGAGMVSGDPAWWAAVYPQLNNCAAVCVHPYAKEAPDAIALVDQYAAITPQVLIDEWNRPLGEIQGFYTDVVEQHAVTGAWAMWSDEQTWATEGVRMGLVDENGNDKPEMKAMEGAINPTPVPPTPPTPTPPTPTPTPPTPPTPTPPAPQPVDQGWLDKKAAVVGAAGELLAIAQEMRDEVSATAGVPRGPVILKLADDVMARANLILS